MSDKHTTEIGTKLVMDDAASATLSKVSHGMGELGHHVQEVQGELRGMMKQAAAVAIGFQFDRGLDSLKELGMEAYHAAAGALSQQKALTGVLSMTDKTGASYEETRERAVALHEDLEHLGIAAGVANDQVIDAFSMIAERSERSREEVFKLTEEMAFAGKAMPGGVEQLAGAFRDLETGIIRPKNALVMLMKQTGVVEGSSKKVAKYVSSLMQTGNEKDKAKAFELAEKAIGRMSDKMKKAPPSFAGVVQSLKDIRENIYEAMGIPMLKAFTGPLVKLKTFFIQHREEIEHWAQVVGVQVGDWAVEAAEKFRDGFAFVQNHAEEIKSALVEGARALKMTLEFMVAHRSVLTAIAAVKAGQSAWAFGGQLAGTVVGGAGAAAQAGGGGAAAAGAAVGIGATAAALSLFTINLGLAAAALYHTFKLWEETRSNTKEANQEARMLALKSTYSKEGDLSKDDYAFIDRMRAELIELGGGSKKAQEGVDAAVRAMQAAHVASESLTKALNLQSMAGVEGGDADATVAAYNAATVAHNEVSRRYAASLIGGSKELQAAFVKSADSIEGGYTKLLELMAEGPDKASFKALLEKAHRPSSLNLNVGQINIKQDFRDQDPDRVVAMFREDLVKHAVSRAGSQFASTFPGL